MAEPPPYTPYNTKVNYVPPGASPSQADQSSSHYTENQHNVHIGFQPPIPANAIVVNQPIIQSVGPNSQMIACPFCHHTCYTRVESEATTKTHLFALLLCIFFCWVCVPIPYCMDSCQSRNHFCSNCDAFLGSYDS